MLGPWRSGRIRLFLEGMWNPKPCYFDLLWRLEGPSNDLEGQLCVHYVLKNRMTPKNYSARIWGPHCSWENHIWWKKIPIKTETSSEIYRISRFHNGVPRNLIGTSERDMSIWRGGIDFSLKPYVFFGVFWFLCDLWPLIIFLMP